MVRPATRRWRAFASVATGAVVALRLAALTQTGCVGPRTDALWRATVRASVERADHAARVAPNARWTRRFALPAPFAEVCDLASTPRGLVVAASIEALGVDGAALYRWDGAAARSLLLWDGQGFLRVHAWGDTLVVPDADAPFRLLPFVFDLDVDGYVFVSSPDGALRVLAVEGIAGYVLRWSLWNGAVLAVVQGASGTGLLRSDDGGRRFVAMPSPREPESVAVVGATLYVLADGALHATDDGATYTEVTPRIEALAHRASSLVSAPLVAHGGSLWAASTRTGEVFEARSE